MRRALLAAGIVAALASPVPVGASADGPPPGHIAFVAGGTFGDGLPAVRASLRLPFGIAEGPGGMYIADYAHYQIRVVGPDGVIRKVAGTTQGFGGDGGPALSAKLNQPAGIAFDTAGNLFIADAANHRVRKVAADGRISTLAGSGIRGFGGDGGPATQASLDFPTDVAAGPDGSVYIADRFNNRIRRVAPDGTISTFAGNGQGLPGVDGVPATVSPIDVAPSVSVGASGDVYVADEGNCKIRKIAAATGTISTVAGNGVCGFAGDGGPASSAQLAYPNGVEVDPSGRIWIGDTLNHRVRVVGTDGVIRTAAGNGTTACPESGPAPGTGAGLNSPIAITVGASGEAHFTTAQNFNTCQRVWRLSDDGTVSLFAGNGLYTAGDSGDPAVSIAIDQVEALVYDASGRPWFAEGGRIWMVDAGGAAHVVAGSTERADKDGPALEARFQRITGMAFDDAGRLYIADRYAGKLKTLWGGEVRTVAGDGTSAAPDSADGPALEVPLRNPHDVAPAADGSVYFIESEPSHRLRVLRVGQVLTVSAGGYGLAGDGGPVSEAKFQKPRGLGLGPDGSLYVADYDNHRIRRIGPDGRIDTIAGDGGAEMRGDGTLAELASFPHPVDVAVGADGDLFVVHEDEGVIRQVAPDGMVTRVAGTGVGGVDGGSGPALTTSLYWPKAAVATPGGVAVVDYRGVKLVTPPTDGWPRPPKNVVCDPPVEDVTGDAGETLAFGVRGPSRPWLDIVTADLRTTPAGLTATIEVDDLVDLAKGPPIAGEGSANVWIHVFRTGSSTYRYLAAISPFTLATGGVDPSLILYEYGNAVGITSESWRMERWGAATGTFDVESDRVTVTASLAVLGVAPGLRILQQEADGGQLVEDGLTRFVGVNDQGPDGGTTRSTVVGKNCPEGY